MGMGSWMEHVGNLGVAGAVLVLIAWLLVKYVPTVEKRHEEERTEWKKERDEWRKYLKDRDSQISILMHDIQQQNERILRVLEHHE